MNRIRDVARKVEQWERKDNTSFSQTLFNQLRHIDWLGWWFVFETLKRNKVVRGIHTGDELQTMSETLKAGFEGRYPAPEIAFVTLAVLEEFVELMPIGLDDMARINLQPEQAAGRWYEYCEDGMLDSRRREDGNRREMYLMLLNPELQELPY